MPSARCGGRFPTSPPRPSRPRGQPRPTAHAAPEAGAIALVRYPAPMRSSEVAARLRDEHSVLVVPGEFFEMDGCLRVGFGSDPEYLTSALTIIGEFLSAVGAHAG